MGRAKRIKWGGCAGDFEMAKWESAINTFEIQDNPSIVLLSNAPI